MDRRRWRSSGDCQDGIPSWVGLSLTGLYLGLVLSLGAVSMWSYREQARSGEQEDTARWVACLGRCVELASADNGLAAATIELRRASRESGIQRCEIVSRQGQVLASSDTTRVGRRLEENTVAALGASDGRPTQLHSGADPSVHSYAIRLRHVRIYLASAGQHTKPVRPASPVEPAPAVPSAGVKVAANATPNPPAGTQRSTPLTQPGTQYAASGAAEPAWLVVEAPGTRDQGAALRWWSAVGYVVLAGLGIFWMLYRLTLRTIRPMAAIRQRLLTTSGQIEEQISLLRLNDTVDQTAAAWNRLVEFVRETHEELQSVQLRTAVDSTLSAYRSERFAAVLQQMPHGVLVVEENGQISFANKAACRMLGRDEEVVNKEVKEVLPESLRASVLGGSRNTSRWVDYAVDGAEGSTTVRFVAVPLDKDAQTASSVIFMQDVSQFKEVERARDAFLYHVTHELRTPLTNIRAYAETLAGGVLDDEASVRECYNVISGETERLGRLVEDILNVSQLEVGTARMNYGEVHMDRMIRDAVQDIQAQADAKGIDLRLHLAAKLPVIRGDKERLSVVVANLLGNAIKYTPSGGHVELTCEIEGQDPPGAEGGQLRLAVTDTGIGIDAAHHEKIFEKFYRVSDERVDAQPGTGLGLAIVKETVRLHGGSVTVESTLGRGSTFSVTLPIAAA
jgi:PAS domain S-box-containing protein